MKIISRDTYKVIPVFIIVVAAAFGLFFLIYITIERNNEKPITIDMIAGLLFFSSIIMIPLTLLIPMFRSIEFFEDRLEINYLFGLIIHRHPYKQLKLAKYFYHKGNGIVVESDAGNQITFGENEYKNYDAIRELLESKIDMVDTIQLRYISRALVIMLILFGLSLIFFLISMNQ
jgi:hypothetical protein